MGQNFRSRLARLMKACRKEESLPRTTRAGNILDCNGHKALSEEDSRPGQRTMGHDASTFEIRERFDVSAVPKVPNLLGFQVADDIPVVLLDASALIDVPVAIADRHRSSTLHHKHNRIDVCNGN